MAIVFGLENPTFWPKFTYLFLNAQRGGLGSTGLGNIPKKLFLLPLDIFSILDIFNGICHEGGGVSHPDDLKHSIHLLLKVRKFASKVVSRQNFTLG